MPAAKPQKSINQVFTSLDLSHPPRLFGQIFNLKEELQSAGLDIAIKGGGQKDQFRRWRPQSGWRKSKGYLELRRDGEERNLALTPPDEREVFSKDPCNLPFRHLTHSSANFPKTKLLSASGLVPKTTIEH